MRSAELQKALQCDSNGALKGKPAKTQKSSLHLSQTKTREALNKVVGPKLEKEKPAFEACKSRAMDS